jgi:anti-sigma factor RsiW
VNSRNSNVEETGSLLIRSYAYRHKLPPGFSERVGTALRKEMSPETRIVRLRSRPAWSWAMAASFLLAIGLSSATTWFVTTPGQQTGFAEQLVASYSRSKVTQHVTDIASSDQRTVRPWLAHKLDIAPPVFDFADGEFPLVGARLDYMDRRLVGVTVYMSGPHVVNVFVRPAEDAQTFPTAAQLSMHGNNVHGWSMGDVNFWAVSDCDPKNLQELEQRIRAAMSSQTSRLEDQGNTVF